MNTKKANQALVDFPHPLLGTTADFAALRASIAASWAKFHRMSKAKQRAELIRRGVLTAEGELPVYPMDHVPLGPRE